MREFEHLPDKELHELLEIERDKEWRLDHNLYQKLIGELICRHTGELQYGFDIEEQDD